MAELLGRDTMRRKRICTIPEKFVQAESKKNIQKTFHFSLITPMFGGDANSWRPDLKHPVRSQAVKGQLRFWWRTMQNIDDISTLINMENRIWGGRVPKKEDKKEVADKNDKKISIRSRVSLSIDNAPPVSKDIICAEMANKYAVKDDHIPRYVLFPITPEVKKETPIHIIKAFDFSLSIAFPEKMKETIMNVLTLWTLFGGVGARTRRGTGSLYCEELLKNFSSERDILEFVHRTAGIETNGQRPEILQLGYPRIAGAGFYASAVKDAEPAEIWHEYLKKYGEYRQDRRPPGNGRRPGTSYWPEPDAIRLLTGDNAKDHEPNHPDKQWFPRAAMGLPIIFKFITPGDPGKNGEEKDDITLEPDIGDNKSRFPSPVILKVIKLPNNRVIKCAFVLNQSFPGNLKLTIEGKDPMAVQDKMLPFYQGYQDEKIMNTKNPLAGRSIFQHLADRLGLEEVK
jgi:CRISPR-associated protein Cmr1